MPRKTKRSITPLMVGHPLGDQDSFGRTAEHFFTEGQEHEARGWDDILPLDDEADPRRRGGSADKLPRRWSAVLALVVLCVCLVAGAAVAGFALFAKGRVGGPLAAMRSWLSVTFGESTALPTPNPVPPETPPQTAPVLLAPAPSQAMPPQAPAAVPAASEAFAIPTKVERIEDKPPQAAPLPDVEGQERLRKDALATRKRRHHSQPRDNYVWSTELNALVPASSMPTVEQPPAPSDAATRRSPTFERSR